MFPLIITSLYNYLWTYLVFEGILQLRIEVLKLAWKKGNNFNEYTWPYRGFLTTITQTLRFSDPLSSKKGGFTHNFVRGVS